AFIRPSVDRIALVVIRTARHLPLHGAGWEGELGLARCTRTPTSATPGPLARLCYPPPGQGEEATERPVVKPKGAFDGDVVAGFVPATDVLVDADVVEAVGGLGGEEQVVDADAGVAAPGAGLEIPEGEGLFAIHGAQGVGHADVFQGAEAFEAFGAVEGVAPPGGGVVGVDGGRDEVKVAHENEGLFP